MTYKTHDQNRDSKETNFTSTTPDTKNRMFKNSDTVSPLF